MTWGAMAGERFLSPEPVVELANAFARPFDNAVATARTCYSGKGIVTEDDVTGPPGLDPDARRERLDRRDALARSIYQAGHHTTLQHAHFQFRLDRVSRHFIWSFLHSHPFYNSEQVSQRYVAVKRGNYAVPPMSDAAREAYESAVGFLHGEYESLVADLMAPASEEFFALFRGRRHTASRWEKTIRKKAMEVARYVLPVATFAYLYHTVSGITLLRYHRLCREYDAPLEQRLVVEKMVAAVLAHDPAYRVVLEEPLPTEETVEHAVAAAFLSGRGKPATRAFLREFDESLGGKTSVLVSHTAHAEAAVASAVREVFGLGRAEMSDDDALCRVLDPALNRTFSEALNLSTHSKAMRALYHAHYTFRKKISHTADSQDQRHRMTPASRPMLEAHFTGEPDYVTPALIATRPAVRERFDRAMRRAFSAAAALLEMGVPAEFAMYLLPNATAIRFTESGDLLNLHHKYRMRLCYNAQEEIWRASLDEVRDICRVTPRIGRYLLPPCTIRKMASAKPVCPEGDRFCGLPVWNYGLEEYQRVI
ncbi:MAG: FAD-dependent thymidylate synthase [Planctomycetes bacterium]|nr:FAD-dependent thymidylate synthase [Planctomycetota bacterium]